MNIVNAFVQVGFFLVFFSFLVFNLTANVAHVGVFSAHQKRAKQQLFSLELLLLLSLPLLLAAAGMVACEMSSERLKAFQLILFKKNLKLTFGVTRTPAHLFFCFGFFWLAFDFLCFYSVFFLLSSWDQWF